MNTTARAKKIAKLEAALVRQQEALADLKRRLPPEPVEDYTLQGPAGPIRLSQLFGQSKDLIVIHNMGRSCRYCTLWADGFNGLVKPLADRAGFAVVSPDSVAVQQKFARSRGWTFPLYSGKHSAFIKDMGFLPKPDEPWPGVSTFRRRGAKIYRIARAGFGPFDPFCSVWHLFALLQGGAGNWEPKYRY